MAILDAVVLTIMYTAYTNHLYSVYHMVCDVNSKGQNSKDALISFTSAGLNLAIVVSS
jgi:hypothetical protein